jgi:protein-S-isoprenylcysteine O-methyltransferase Ste14
MPTFVFKYRFWLFTVVFAIGQLLYGVDHTNTGVWLVHLVAPTLDPDSAAGHTGLRIAFSFGAACVVLCAVVRTWATGYLRSDVVHDDRIHTEALVANGPYRYVRNPLYLGGLLLAVGIGELASRLGFVFTVAGVAAITAVLIYSEEQQLALAQSASYEEYRRRVPRLIPSLTPRVPSGGARVKWGQAILGEMLMWILAAVAIGTVVTLRSPVVLWVFVVGIAVHITIVMLQRSARPAAVVVMLAGAALVFDARVARAQVFDQASFDWNGQIPAGATVHVVTTDGDIDVSAASGPAAQVHGERTHILSGSRALVFEVITSGNDVTVCARERDGSCDSDGVHGEHHFMRMGETGSARLSVQLPAGVKLAAKSGDGSIEARGVRADMVAKTGDGSIHVTSVTGSVRAHSGDGEITLEDIQGPVVEATSGDGSIEIRLSTAAVDPQITARSGDGSVKLYVPGALNGEISASTGDGRIDCEFPVQLTGRLNSQHLHATLGSGGAARIEVSTGDGDITVRKS